MMLAERILPKIEDKIEKEICGRLFDIQSTVNLAVFDRILEAITNFGDDNAGEIIADNDLVVALNKVILEANIILKIVGTEDCRSK